FGGAIRVPGINYVNFLIPGIIVQTAAFGAIGTAIGLSDELSKGVIDRFRSMPISRSAVLIGRLASDMLRNLVTVLILLGVGYGIGFRPTTGVGALVAAVCIAVLFSLAISCISAFIGLAVKDPESVQMFGFIWIFPLTFASNVFAPTASMPGWLQAWVKVNPVSIVSEALRNLTLGGPTVTHVWESFVWMAAIVAVFLTLAVRAYRRVT
ncbi:MAG: ABC transporter permease, partial [Acidimicrobiales bacterium]